MTATTQQKTPAGTGFDLDRSDWALVSFGDVAKKQNTSVDRDNTELTRYVAGEHMGSEDLHLRQWGEIGEDYLGPAFTRKFEKDDILYGSRRTYLRKVAVAHFDGITANTTFVIKPNTKLILPELLPFVMLSEGFAQHSIRNSKGSVNPYVNWKDIANYEFLLPPKDQQAKLAELLWAADSSLNSRRTAVDLHRDLKISVVAERCVDCPDSEEYIFEDLVESMHGGKSLVCLNETFVSGSAGILKTSAVTSGTFIPSEAKPVPSDEIANLSIHVQGDSILINRKNTRELVGVSCYVANTYPNLYLSDLMWQIRTNEKVLAKYLFHLLSSAQLRTHLSSLSNGTSTTMLNVAKGSVNKIRIRIPPLSAQRRFLEEMEQIEIVEAKLESAVRNSNALLKSLVNQIF